MQVCMYREKNQQRQSGKKGENYRKWVTDRKTYRRNPGVSLPKFKLSCQA